MLKNTVLVKKQTTVDVEVFPSFKIISGEGSDKNIMDDSFQNFVFSAVA